MPERELRTYAFGPEGNASYQRDRSRTDTPNRGRTVGRRKVTGAWWCTCFMHGHRVDQVIQTPQVRESAASRSPRAYVHAGRRHCKAVVTPFASRQVVL